MMFQTCFKKVSRMLQRNFMCVSSLFEEHFMGVLSTFEKRLDKLLAAFQEGFKCVEKEASKVFDAIFNFASRKFQGCVKSV